MFLFTPHADAAQVTLSWDDLHNQPTAVEGYRLYYWQADEDSPTSIDVGNQRTYRLTGLAPGKTYQVAVTAYGRNGSKESDFSNTIRTTLATVAENPLRVTQGLQVIYTFEEGNGSTVGDVSGIDPAVDLRLSSSTATEWIEGGLAFRDATMVASVDAATKVIKAVQASNEITVEAWIKSANTTQRDQACVVTLSPSPSQRTCTLAQQGAHYAARLPTTRTSTNGLRTLTTPDDSLTTELEHVVYTRDAAGVARLYIDAIEWAQGTMSGTVVNGSTDYRVLLGNAPSGNRPWRGEFYLMAIYNRAFSAAEVLQNFEAGPDGDGS